MPALALTSATVAATFPVAVLFAAAVIVVLLGWASCSPEQRQMRERRHHAERTARAMRRMTEIRRQTAEQMDRIQGSGRR
jgi:hypothetical protein